VSTRFGAFAARESLILLATLGLGNVVRAGGASLQTRLAYGGLVAYDYGSGAHSVYTSIKHRLIE
jgi:hypothetical protein